MSKYITTIGLEIHVELKTQTKMFCSSLNNPDEKEANVNICPICLGHPGTLPTLNKEAIKHVLKVGYAIGAQIADFTEWDRKNYFYPDIPKGYQISQYKYPLISGGKISNVEITRIHLEEDTGISQHDKGNYSLINFNRAGVPLMELVTEPVIHSANQAANFAKELQLLVRYLGVSGANMEKGEMRVEANISIAPEGSKKLGTKVEVKNLNSFKTVEKAIEYEIKRMTELFEEGREDEIIQETRGWDEAKQNTFSQRIKETSDDYRYFPEPDLPKLKISEIPEFSEEILKKEIPELPWERRSRFLNLGLTVDQADFFVQTEKMSQILDEIILKNSDKKVLQLTVNYLSTDLASIIHKGNENVFDHISADNLLELILMIVNNKISSRGAKDILLEMAINGGSPNKIGEEKNLLQQSNSEDLKRIAEQVILENPKAVQELKAGKENSLKFLMGQGMRISQGSANPKLLAKILQDLI